jgi:hypothetical protein
MTTKAVQTTIRLGSINLEVYHLENGYYSAPGLFRLVNTDIYRYEECWYWLGSNGIPDLKKCKFWGPKNDVFLAFQGNKLCYRYVNPSNPGSGLYAPIPRDIQSVMEFCVLGKLASDKAILRLNKVLDRTCPVNNGYSPAIITAGLLKDTSTYLPKIEGSVADAKKKKSSRTSNKHRVKLPLGYDGFIYLVKLDAHLKLGFTKNLNKRLKSFESTNVGVELIKSVYGTIQDEKRLHSSLGSKARELYDFKDQQRIIRAMMDLPRIVTVSVAVRY